MKPAPAILAAALLLATAAGTAAAHRSRPRADAAPSADATARATALADAAPGETVYYGTVFPLRGAAAGPTYVYERRVAEQAGLLLSTHVTRDPAGSAVLHESATHREDYALVEYALHANQLGQRGTIRVEGDRVTFERLDADGRRTEVERAAGPVVVGPTLVGFMVRHLDDLRGGEVLGVRMAILERLETIGFELRAVEAQPGQTRVRMAPSSLLLSLVVDPIDFTFETATRRLVRLEGRVPPKLRDGGDWRDFDARVEYRFAAASYR